MFRCKFKGVVFDVGRVVAFSEKCEQLAQQKMIIRGDYPSAGKDTNCLKFCVQHKEPIYIYIGNIPSETVETILNAILVNGYFNLDNNNYKFIVDAEDKIKCYEKKTPYIFITAWNYQQLAMDDYESTEYRTMQILEDDNVFLHPELAEDKLSQ